MRVNLRDPLTRNLILVGIRTRGVPLSEEIAEEIERMEGVRVPVGVLDITLYRDDLSTIAPQPVVKETHFPTDLSEAQEEVTAQIETSVRTAFEQWLLNNKTSAESIVARVIISARARAASPERSASTAARAAGTSASVSTMATGGLR